MKIVSIPALARGFLAAVLPIDTVAALANAGTLIAFIAVGMCLLVMRRRAPNLPRPFKAPAGLLVGGGAVVGCFYLFANLPTKTLLCCLIWNIVGLLLYFGYAFRRSLLRSASA